MDVDDKYRIALDTRNFEIRLFWDRSNFFLALNTAIAVGFFSLSKERYAPFLALFGLICSTLWILANLGSKFWQVRWEQKLASIERESDPDAKLFSEPYDTIKKDVSEYLAKQSSGWLGRRLNNAILRKPSVTRMAILLSVWFGVSWFGLLLWSLLNG